MHSVVKKFQDWVSMNILVAWSLGDTGHYINNILIMIDRLYGSFCSPNNEFYHAMQVLCYNCCIGSPYMYARRLGSWKFWYLLVLTNIHRLSKNNWEFTLDGKTIIAVLSQATECDLWSILHQWSKFHLDITFNCRVNTIFVKVVFATFANSNFWKWM